MQTNLYALAKGIHNGNVRFLCIMNIIFITIYCVKRDVTVFGVILVQMRQNTDQNNSEYGHFSRIDCDYYHLKI